MCETTKTIKTGTNVIHRLVSGRLCEICANHLNALVTSGLQNPCLRFSKLPGTVRKVFPFYRSPSSLHPEDGNRQTSFTGMSMIDITFVQKIFYVYINSNQYLQFNVCRSKQVFVKVVAIILSCWFLVPIFNKQQLLKSLLIWKEMNPAFSNKKIILIDLIVTRKI